MLVARTQPSRSCGKESTISIRPVIWHARSLRNRKARRRATVQDLVRGDEIGGGVVQRNAQKSPSNRSTPSAPPAAASGGGRGAACPGLRGRSH